MNSHNVSGMSIRYAGKMSSYIRKQNNNLSSMKSNVMSNNLGNSFINQDGGYLKNQTRKIGDNVSSFKGGGDV